MKAAKPMPWGPARAKLTTPEGATIEVKRPKLEPVVGSLVSLALCTLRPTKRQLLAMALCLEALRPKPKPRRTPKGTPLLDRRSRR